MSAEHLLWEWVDLGDRSKIYTADKDSHHDGFIIGGLKPSQAKQLVCHHNESIRTLERHISAHTRWKQEARREVMDLESKVSELRGQL